MKKLKLAFWIIVIAFFALLVYQNLNFFLETNDLKIDIGIYSYQTPLLTNGAIIAAFVGIGVLITLIFYFASLYNGYRGRKTILMLQQALETNSGEVAELKKQIAMLKGEPAAEPEPEPVAVTQEADTAAQS
jgi:hypothetical protein